MLKMYMYLCVLLHMIHYNGSKTHIQYLQSQPVEQLVWCTLGPRNSPRTEQRKLTLLQTSWHYFQCYCVHWIDTLQAVVVAAPQPHCQLLAAGGMAAVAAAGGTVAVVAVAGWGRPVNVQWLVMNVNNMTNICIPPTIIQQSW